MAPKRPTAFEVSYPEDVLQEETLRKKREDDENERRRLGEILVAQQIDQRKLKRKEREQLKRKEKELRNGFSSRKSVEFDGQSADEVDFSRPTKKMQLDLPTEYYFTRPDEVMETADTFLEGEDELFDDDGSDEEDSDTSVQSRSRTNGDRTCKPIRLLTDFTIFDTRHKNEYVVLSQIEEEEGVDRRFEATGWAVPSYTDEQDLMGEDGGAGEEVVEPVFMRIGPMLGYSVDWRQDNDPIYIETPHAWYALRMPAKNYERWYQVFYMPRRVAQIVISCAVKRRQINFGALVRGALHHSTTIFGDQFEEDDIWTAAEIIRVAVEEIEQKDPGTRLRPIPAIAHIIKNATPHIRSRLRIKSHLNGPGTHRRSIHTGLLAGLKNPDLAVLKQENQTSTHVTPLIASLARGFVNEELIVIGPPPTKGKGHLQDAMREKKAQLRSLWALIERAKGGILDVGWHREDKVTQRSNYLRRVYVGGEVYKPGDFVLVPHGKYGTKNLAPEWPRQITYLPSSATIANYFWFARIIYIKIEEQIAHVQWLEHASQTMLQELANQQEVFFCTLCNPVPLSSLVSKVKVHVNPPSSVQPDEFFARYIHDKLLETYVGIPRDYHRFLEHYTNPTSGTENPILDYCSSCADIEKDNHKMQWEYEPGPSGQGNRQDSTQSRGVRFNDKVYHIYDFVLYRANEGPSNIGQIIDFIMPRFGRRSTMIFKVKKVGRIWNIVGTVACVERELKDQKHVFLTDEEAIIPYTDIITKAVVLSRESFGQRMSLRRWLDVSPYHFYVCYRFHKLIPETGDEKSLVSFRDLDVCKRCTGETMRYYYDVSEFKNKMQEKPMRILDLFGGVGAFSLGLKEGSGCLMATHALEISPSAAKTFKKNNVGTEVVNQCINTVLRYVVKKRAGHRVERPVQLWDTTGKTPIPDLPAPGSFDMITAGFPCQTHSQLNMFKTANDTRSNLILNALSWVDHYRPRYVYFENVTGFLSFHPNARQAGVHRLEGGVTMGGLKLLIRALLEMGYQIRYSLLQAGHYGTPQRRVRFFVIASQGTLPLPDIPQPTHDFPQVHGLVITMPNGDPVKPVRTITGTAPHPSISIEDAIGDLLRFDWKRPGQARRNDRGREDVPALVCDHKNSRCGYEGRGVGYHCEPKTSYQRDSRTKESTDLQHYTKTVKARKVDRVLGIPMKPGADFRSLKADMYEWQLTNPASSSARRNFRSSWYGRLDGDSFFPTIVTNIDPTAKQSKVLHPYCKRMITVRELARAQGFPDWFVFETYKGNVATIHRQIGNAVPLPLGRALGREFGEMLFREWKEGRLESIGEDRGMARDEDDEDKMEVENFDGGGVQQHERDHEMPDGERDSDVDSMEGLYS